MKLCPASPQDYAADLDKPVNIIIDDCFFSRSAITALYQQAGTPFDIIGLTDIHDFYRWRHEHSNRINSMMISIHDRTSSISEALATFLVADLNTVGIAKSDVVLIVDALNHFMSISVRKLKIFNLLCGFDSLRNISSQLREFVIKGTINPSFVTRCMMNSTRQQRKNAGELSPAESLAISSVLTGKGVKEFSKTYHGHYKTLYNQRLSAIKKLGMGSIHDIIKYRYFIDALYLTEAAMLPGSYHEFYC